MLTHSSKNKKLIGLIVIIGLLGLLWWLRQPAPTSTPRSSPSKGGPTLAPVEFPTEQVRLPQADEPVTVAKDRLTVQFKQGVTESQRRQLWQSVGGTRETSLGLRMYSIAFPTNVNFDAVVTTLNQSELTEFAERDPIMTIQYEPNDYRLKMEPYWWNQINMPTAWDYSRGGGISVAVIDQGVSTSHGDLAGKVTIVANPAYRYQGEGFHGTHVAGIACADTDNGLGVAGGGFECHVMGVQALSNSSGSGGCSGIAAAINKATESGAKIINLSLGGAGCSAMRTALDNAWQQGVLPIAAAGNSNSPRPSNPAGYSSVLAVGATDSSQAKANFSNYGTWVDVFAPGKNILSTWTNNGYNAISGTSMATPVVSGLAALCWSANPSLSNMQVRDLLIKHTFSGNLQPGQVRAGSGIVDGASLLPECAQEPLPTPTPGPGGEPVAAYSCHPVEWLCRDDDVVDPEQKCCQCGAIIAPTPPYDPPCITNQDEGQKDGTGKSGLARQYRWFDPDIGKIIQVPPVVAPSQ